MTPKREKEIIGILKTGKVIVRQWNGTNRSGNVSCHLEGSKRITNTECDELRKKGIVMGDKDNYKGGGFYNYKLK